MGWSGGRLTKFYFMLTDAQILAKYGEPGDTDNLVSITLPYPMRIAWDVSKSVNKVSCHKLIAANLAKVFDDLLEVYGFPELQKLEIDLFGGCYNFRKMRNGNRWSRHSWAIAIDLSPSKNGLKTKSPVAQFSKPEYKKMIDIFYSNGFLSYGVERNNDWMHFEISN